MLRIIQGNTRNNKRKFKRIVLGVTLAGMWLIGAPTASQGGHFHVSNTELRVVHGSDTEQAIDDVRSTPTATKHRNKSQNVPRRIMMNVSAYTRSSDECNKGDGITASGVRGVPFRTCAADDLPFGTRLRVNGEIWIVQDRFGGGYVNRLDLMMETKEQCFSFGRQYIEVEILDAV